MLAERIKQLRKEKGMTQIDLAKALDVSNGTVAMWETGKRKPNYELLNQLSGLFDKQISYILGVSDDSRPASLTESEIEQLGEWAIEEEYEMDAKLFASLDDKGQKAVHDLIREQVSRCVLEGTLRSTTNLHVEIRTKKVNIANPEQVDDVQ